jgi:hypothetical protein
VARLWTAAAIGAAIPWVYKLVTDRGAPLLSAHENAVPSKLLAFALLAVYGVTYVGITAAFGVPEASNVVDRGKRLLRLPFRRR